MRLENKVAVVTGGSSGIGRAIVNGFVKEGAKVVIAAINENQCLEAVEEVKQAGGRAIYVVTDISNLDDHERLLGKAVDEFGKLDILVNDAAYSAREGVLDVTPESWDKHMSVNLRGLFFLSQSFARRIIAQGSGGRIINIGSVAGVMDFHPVSIAYQVTKAGVIHITRVMGADLALYKITVNCIAPGSTFTPMSSSAKSEYLDYLTQGIPEGRLARPEEMVPPAVMFASDEAEYITGQTLFVEGGALAVYLGRPSPAFKA
ncbi:MAG TPA: glucose 1-dehydrogenase [Thermodesulfobacteriota bacterium]|nr:glucose 1-dehydrogenase [Thermodesulfobacteriota bacterium]